MFFPQILLNCNFINKQSSLHNAFIKICTLFSMNTIEFKNEYCTQTFIQFIWHRIPIFLENWTCFPNFHTSSFFMVCSPFAHISSSLCWFFLLSEGIIIFLRTWAETSVCSFHSYGWKHLSALFSVRCRQPHPLHPHLLKDTAILQGAHIG